MQKLPRLLEISPGRPLMHGRRLARAACQHLRDAFFQQKNRRKGAKKIPPDWLGRYMEILLVFYSPFFLGGGKGGYLGWFNASKSKYCWSFRRAKFQENAEKNSCPACSLLQAFRIRTKNTPKDDNTSLCFRVQQEVGEHHLHLPVFFSACLKKNILFAVQVSFKEADSIDHEKG